MVQDHSEKFIFDIYRSIILSSYINEWGQPSNRTVFKKLNETSIEVYVFPPKDKNLVTRIVTIGVGLVSHNKKQMHNFEYLFTFPNSFVETHENELIEYLVDISLHLLKSEAESDIRVISNISIAPDYLSQKSILVDEARGESESLSDIYIAENFNNVSLKWVIPIYENEANFILKNGIEEFDKLDSETEISLVDIHRASLI